MTQKWIRATVVLAMAVIFLFIPDHKKAIAPEVIYFPFFPYFLSLFLLCTQNGK